MYLDIRYQGGKDTDEDLCGRTGGGGIFVASGPRLGALRY